METLDTFLNSDMAMRGVIEVFNSKQMLLDLKKPFLKNIIHQSLFQLFKLKIIVQQVISLFIFTKKHIILKKLIEVKDIAKDFIPYPKLSLIAING